MSTDTFAGKWKQIRGKLQQRWGKLTDDDWDRVEGKREELEGRIQERYGQTKDQVKKELDEFMKDL